MILTSVAEPELKPEPPEAAVYRAAPEPEPIFWLVGAESRGQLFKATSAPPLMKAKKKSFVLVPVLGMNSVQFIKLNMFQNRIEQINFYRAQSYQF